MVDFFRDLPESLCNEILSMLDIKDLARVSKVSRHCRKLCLSTPSLTLDLGYIRNKEQVWRFSEYVRQFMFLRMRDGVDIHQFQVKSGHCGGGGGGDYFPELLIRQLILMASILGAKKICLDLRRFKYLDLSEPKNSAFSRCLTDLEVCLWSKDAMLRLPTTSFKRLRSLKLRYLRVSNEFGDWVSSCKSLEMLYLEEVEGMNELNITSSSLEYLKLHAMPIVDHQFNIHVSADRLKFMHVQESVFPHTHISLTFHAPKLEQLFLYGIVSDYSCQGNLQSLRHSHICIHVDHNHEQQIIGKVLQSVYRVSSLCIHDCSLKKFFPQDFLLLPEFCNLRSLTLKRMYSFNAIPSTASLLNLMPHLDTLKIEGFQNSAHGEEICYNAQYWESRNLKFVHSLKELKMEFCGEKNEIELLKYFLKNAKALKTLTIYYPWEFRYTQSEISRNIQQFQIASSSIAFYFFCKS